MKFKFRSRTDSVEIADFRELKITRDGLHVSLDVIRGSPVHGLQDFRMSIRAHAGGLVYDGGDLCWDDTEEHLGYRHNKLAFTFGCEDLVVSSSDYSVAATNERVVVRHKRSDAVIYRLKCDGSILRIS